MRFAILAVCAMTCTFGMATAAPADSCQDAQPAAADQCRDSQQQQLIGVMFGGAPAGASTVTAPAGVSGAAAPNTTWAVDVSPALGADAPAPTQNTLKVYQGGADAKEFKF